MEDRRYTWTTMRRVRAACSRRTEVLHEILDELRALGWHAVAHGPEIHLALPVLYLILALLVLFWRRSK